MSGSRHSPHGVRRGFARLAPLLLGLLPLCAGAYQRAGHYYSIDFSYLDVLQQTPADAPGPHFDARDIKVIAFCTQLPDQSSDLDAVRVYFHAMYQSPYAWAKWATAGDMDSDAIRRMVLVQQLLHGLTGGDVGAVQAAATATIAQLAAAVSSAPADTADRNASLCALGFAMHLYGDSYAHIQMSPDEPGQPLHMYPTGRGHAADIHYPDYPLCSEFAPSPRIFRHCDLSRGGRFAAWKGYLDGIYAAIYPASQVPSGYWSTVDNVVNTVYTAATDSTARTVATDGNDWDENVVQGKLYSPADTASLESFFDHHESSEACEAVLATAFAPGGKPQPQGAFQRVVAFVAPSTVDPPQGPLQGFQPFTCKAVWTKFARVAKQEFAAQGAKIRSDERWDPDPLALNSTITPF